MYTRMKSFLINTSEYNTHYETGTLAHGHSYCWQRTIQQNHSHTLQNLIWLTKTGWR